jgi:hypothetical protein
MFLRRLTFTRLHGVMSQNRELLKNEDINDSYWHQTTYIDLVLLSSSDYISFLIVSGAISASF